MIAFDRRLLEGAVHPLDLTVLVLGESVIDVVLAQASAKERQRDRSPFAMASLISLIDRGARVLRIGKVDAVVD